MKNKKSEQHKMQNEKLNIVVEVLENLSQEIEREKTPFATDSDFNYGLVTAYNMIKELLEDRSRLVGIAVSLYEPTVANVCLRFGRGENVSDEEVSRLLDALLGFCFDTRAVGLFKKVCKEAFPTKRSLVADYIRYYREEWETK